MTSTLRPTSFAKAWIAAALASFALLYGAAASAQEATSEEAAEEEALAIAQRYVELGEELFRREKYGEAVENFLKAEQTLAEPEIDVPAALYRSIARCYDQLGQLAAALGYYKRFLALAEPSTGRMQQALKDAQDAEHRLETLLDRTAIRFEVDPAGTQITLDRRRVGVSPIEAPVKTPPGPHQITLRATGYEPEFLTVTVKAGAEVPVVVKLRPESPSTPAEPPPPPVPAPPPPQPDHTWGYGAMGLGGVGLVAAAGAVVLFRNSRNAEADGDALLKPVFPNTAAAEEARTEAQQHYDESASSKTWGTVMTGVSVAALGAAGWMLYLELSRPKPEPSMAGGSLDRGTAGAQGDSGAMPQVSWTAGHGESWVGLRWGF